MSSDVTSQRRSPCPPAPSEPTPVGLVAGWGRYPIVVAQALRCQGHEVFCLGIKGHADPALAELVDDMHWVGLGKLGAAIRYFRRAGVRRATMAGKIHKVVLFERFAWLRHLPDWRCVRTFWPHLVARRKDRKDDTLLIAVVEAFAEDGITFGPATDYAPELLVKHGLLTRRGPSAAQRKDIAFGWEIAKEMGRLDIGQSVVVKDMAVIAVEAIEGTDLCIQRAGQLCPVGGFTVVKTAKPQQDMRFDVPTIGLGTVRNMHAAGGRVLAVEAGRTIIIDQSEVLRFADDNAMAIVALDAAGLLAAA